MSDTTSTTPAPVFRIVRTRQGMGGFMAPPGHPDHFYEVRGYWPRGNRAVNIARRREADSCSSLSGTLKDEFGDVPASVKAQAQRIMDRAEMTCSEAWVRSVYGYFRNSYSPDGTDRNVSNAISTSKVHCRCGEDFWNQRGLNAHLDKFAEDIHNHYQVTKTMPPAEHHLGYLCVRSYFPDHAPRLDLIDNPGHGYGSYPCAKCSKTIQYEAREDAFAEVIPGASWKYVTDCPQGGKHEIAQA
jgi:hypothetical protein